MTGLKKEIIYDLDGTLTNSRIDSQLRTRATIVTNLSYILDEPGCTQTSNIAMWGAVTVCNQNVTIRKVTFMNVLPVLFTNFFAPTVWRMPKLATESSRPTIIATSISNMDASAEIKNSWSSPFVAGSTYKIKHDFSLGHVDILTSPLAK